MPQRRRALPGLLVQPRQIEVRVGELLVRLDRPPVRRDRVGPAAEVLERGAQVEGGGRIRRLCLERIRTSSLVPSRASE